MNANELAEIQAFKTEELTMWERNHTATMLRQQQEEIEALKAGKIRAYDNGVEDGRKPNTNLVKELIEEKSYEVVFDGEKYTTKLVEPKVKELTDEKIWEVIDNYFGVHAFNLDYQISLDEAREDAFELVKAILRKASEK